MESPAGITALGISAPDVTFPTDLLAFALSGLHEGSFPRKRESSTGAMHELVAPRLIGTAFPSPRVRAAELKTNSALRYRNFLFFWQTFLVVRVGLPPRGAAGPARPHVMSGCGQRPRGATLLRGAHIARCAMCAPPAPSGSTRCAGRLGIFLRAVNCVEETFERFRVIFHVFPPTEVAHCLAYHVGLARVIPLLK